MEPAVPIIRSPAPSCAAAYCGTPVARPARVHFGPSAAACGASSLAVRSPALLPPATLAPPGEDRIIFSQHDKTELCFHPDIYDCNALGFNGALAEYILQDQEADELPAMVGQCMIPLKYPFTLDQLLKQRLPLHYARMVFLV